MLALGKKIAVGALLVVLGGCAEPDPFALKTVPKGAQVDIRQLLNAHPNQSICIDYKASSDTCASVISAKLRGSVVDARELGAFTLPDGSGTRQLVVRSRSKVVDGGLCATSNNFRVEGSDDMAQFVQEASRALVDDFGGSVCTTYFEAASGDGYVIRSVGANGEPFPPGEWTARFISEPARIRAQ